MADPYRTAETHSHMSYVITAVVFAAAGLVFCLAHAGVFVHLALRAKHAALTAEHNTLSAAHSALKDAHVDLLKSIKP